MSISHANFEFVYEYHVKCKFIYEFIVFSEFMYMNSDTMNS
jgi:hypothetical protein